MFKMEKVPSSCSDEGCDADLSWGESHHLTLDDMQPYEA